MDDTTIMLLIVAALLSLPFIIFMRNTGLTKYKIRFFQSWTFAIFLLAVIFSFFAIQDINKAENPENASQVIEWIWIANLAAFFPAAAFNIRRTNISFGILYTIAQLIAACLSGFAMLIALALSIAGHSADKKDKKRKRT